MTYTSLRGRFRSYKYHYVRKEVYKDIKVEGVQYENVPVDFYPLSYRYALGSLRLKKVIDKNAIPVFNDVHYMRAKTYRLLLAELMFSIGPNNEQPMPTTPLKKTLNFTFKNGVWFHIMAKLGFIDNLKYMSFPTPSGVKGYEYVNFKRRLFSAAYTGFLEAVIAWDSTKVEDESIAALGSLFSTIHFSIERYMQAEYRVYRGERDGSSVSYGLNEKISSQKARIVSIAYSKAQVRYGSNPSIEEILSTFDELGIDYFRYKTSKGIKKDVRSWLESYLSGGNRFNSYNTVVDKIEYVSSDVKADIVTINNNLYASTNSLSGSLGVFGQEQYESLDFLNKIRCCLFKALAENKGNTGNSNIFSPDFAEVLDLLLFHALSLDGEYGYAIDEIEVNSIMNDLIIIDDLLKENVISDKDLVEKRKILFNKLLEKLTNHYVQVPDVVPGSSLGKLYFPKPPLNYLCVPDKTRYYQLRSLFRPSRKEHCVALHIAMRKVGVTDPRAITRDLFKESLNFVIMVRNYVHSKGFLRPFCKNSLSLINELYMLRDGYTPIVVRDAVSDFAVGSAFANFENKKPMLSWEAPLVKGFHDCSDIFNYKNIASWSEESNKKFNEILCVDKFRRIKVSKIIEEALKDLKHCLKSDFEICEGIKNGTHGYRVVFVGDIDNKYNFWEETQKRCITKYSLMGPEKKIVVRKLLAQRKPVLLTEFTKKSIKKVSIINRSRHGKSKN